MNITPARGNFIEKIVRDQQGRLVRATFCVYEYDGRVKARLVQATVIDDIPTSETPFLSAYIPQIIFETALFESRLVSPYFSSNTLYFSGSKPRAPTYTK